MNTPGTRIGPGGQNWIMAVKRNWNFWKNIPSDMGAQKNQHPGPPQSEWKAINGEKEWKSILVMAK